MFASPSLPGSREAEARSMLDTVAAVAADPAGYKTRVAELDAATVKSLEAETKARAAERDAKDALDALRAERQKLEADLAKLNDATAESADRIRREAKRLDGMAAARTRDLDDRESALNVRSSQLLAMERDLTAKIEIHTKATEALVAEQRKAEQLNAELAHALSAAKAREEKAAAQIAKMRAALT